MNFERKDVRRLERREPACLAFHQGSFSSAQGPCRGTGCA